MARRLKDRNVTFELAPSGLEFILQEAYDPQYGARPLRRYLEKEIGTSVGRMILTNELLDNSVVHISENGKQIEYQVKPLPHTSSPKRSHAQMMEQDGSSVEDLDDDADEMEVDG